MMTFQGFLLYCMVPPVVLLLWLQRHTLKPSYLAINLIVGLGSIFYTSPWDQSLIARRVWWFDTSRTLGLQYAGFPVEEALFYVLIIALGGLWTHFVFTRIAPDLGSAPRRPAIRLWGALAVAALWLLDVAAVLWLTPLVPRVTFFTQCVLITLPALVLQIALCGDLLWHRRQYLAASVIVPGIYLSLVAGTFTFGTELWVVNPELSFGKLFGMIPAEMPLFYLLASGLIALPSSTLLPYDAAYFEGTLIGRAGLDRLTLA